MRGCDVIEIVDFSVDDQERSVAVKMELDSGLLRRIQVKNYDRLLVREAEAENIGPFCQLFEIVEQFVLLQSGRASTGIYDPDLEQAHWSSRRGTRTKLSRWMAWRHAGFLSISS